MHGGTHFAGPTRARPGHHADPRQACSTGAPAPDVLPAGCRNRRRAALGDAPAVGCFDTAFHAGLPEAAATYAVPREWRASLGRASLWLPRPEPCLRLATHDRAHGALGHGCPCGHLPPGCRSIAGRRRRGPFGGHDDGLHPLRRAGHGHPIGHRRPRPDPLACPGAAASQSPTLPGRARSTNRGCTRSPARRTWRKSRRSSSRVTTRPDWPSMSTCTGCERAIAAMASAMGGLDAVTFTGGVGENAALVRADTLSRMGFLGLSLDDEANGSAPPDAEITGPRSRVRIFVIRAREDLQIASEVRSLLE